jgi:hypothetical protein
VFIKKHSLNMQFTLRLILALILFCGALPTQAEDYSGIRFGLKVPYSYSGNYYIRLADRWGAYGGVQFNTFPFGGAPVTYLQVFSSNEKDALAEVLREPFSIGAGFDVGAHYYMGADNRRYYIAASLQWTNLLKRDISDDVVEAAFVVELDDYPLGPILEQDSKKPLTLNTHYLNLGHCWRSAFSSSLQSRLGSGHGIGSAKNPGFPSFSFFRLSLFDSCGRASL